MNLYGPEEGRHHGGKMKTAIYRKYGEPADVVEIIDEETQPPGEGEAVIAVEAAPIHLGDLYNMRGQEGFQMPLPMVPGIEGVGRIVEIGKAVDNFKIGDRVLFLSSAHVDAFIDDQRGTWRQQIRLPAEILIPIPEGDAAQFANIVNPATAYVYIHDVTKPEQGEWLLQNAANSNVGRYLIRLANIYGCKTVNVVRRESLIGELKELGADAVVMDGPDLATRVAEATGGADIRFGLDALAGAATTRIASCLARSGIVYNVGLVSGEPCEVPSWMMLNRDIRLHGFFAGTPLMARSPEEQRALFSELAQMMSDGTLPAKIAGTYSLDQIREAVIHAGKDGADRDGKVIILPNPAA